MFYMTDKKIFVIHGTHVLSNYLILINRKQFEISLLLGYKGSSPNFGFNIEQMNSLMSGGNKNVTHT